MEKRDKRFKRVDEYINSFSDKIKERLEKIREIIEEEAPEAEEVISYNMPAYKFHGMLLYFAVHKEHIGIYAMPSAILAFKKELSEYETSKGGIKFPFGRPFPYELLRKIIQYRVKENIQKIKKKIK